MNLTDNGLKLPALQVHWLQRMQFCSWFGYAQPFYKYIPGFNYSGNVFSTSSKPLTPWIYFIHLNARSLNSNFREIDDNLSSLNYKFDIIAISETWVSEPEHNKFNINGYDVYHTTRKNKIGGGVALYVKQELECKFLSYKASVVDDLFECCTIEMLLSGHRNIIVSYRCPGSNTDILLNTYYNCFFN